MRTSKEGPDAPEFQGKVNLWVYLHTLVQFIARAMKGRCLSGWFGDCSIRCLRLYLKTTGREDDALLYMTLSSLLEAVRGCRICEPYLPMGPRPVLVCAERARLLIVGQAPGLRVHETGIPWNDPSGDRLRTWMAIDKETFYDDSRIAIIPMGYCYPGSGGRGDLPPRKECAELWLGELLKWLPRLKLCLLVGQYSQRYFLGGRRSLTDRVSSWRSSPPGIIPLPHPSPRNALWFKKNPWFSKDLLPDLRSRVQETLSFSSFPENDSFSVQLMSPYENRPTSPYNDTPQEP